MTRNVDRTTAEVVDRPTASGPPRTLNPSRHPTCAMMVANATLFNSPRKTSRRTIESKTYVRYIQSVMSELKYMKPAPDIMPKKLLITVRHGTAMSAAINLGARTYSTGSIAIVRNASISLVATIVPISAENADPDRPLTTIAVTSGPNSRVNPMATILMTNWTAPNRRSSAAVWSERITPTHIDKIAIKGSPCAPIAITCFMAVRQRLRMPMSGSTRLEARRLDQNCMLRP